MPTLDKHGRTQCTISTQSGLLHSSLASARNQTCFSGSDLNSGVLVSQPDFSTTKSQTQLDGDTEAICSTTTQMFVSVTEFCTPSPMEIRSTQLFSELIHPLPKAVNSSKKNGTLFANLPQKFSRKTTSFSPTKCQHKFQLSPISDACGNTTASISLD